MAVKPIIIPLVADTAGLTIGIEALEQLGAVDAKTAADFKAANKAFADRGKVIEQAVSPTDKLAAASKKLVESITGGAITQATANIQKLTQQVDSTNSEFIALTKTIQLAKKQLASLQQGTPAFAKLSKEIQAAELAMGNFEKEAISSRGQLKQYRETLLQLEDAGLESTKVFEDMAIAAGKLQDQIGDTAQRIKVLSSDTFKFDVAIQGIQGLAGAFSVAQGAAALFGSENDDLQKGLLKVNAAMAVLTGLQQIQNIIQAESAVSIGVTNALKTIEIARTNLDTAAQSTNIVVKYAAIAAQKVLNAVMAASPAGIILLAISTLAGALLLYSDNAETAAEKQARLNEEMDKTNALLDEQITNSTALRATNKGGLNDQQQELTILQAKGALQSKLLDQQRKVLEAEKQNAEVVKQSLAGQKGREKEFNEAAKNVLDIELKINENRLQGQKAFQDESLKSATAFAEAKVSKALKGSKDELNAQIAALRAREREDLASTTITQGERTRIINNTERQIKELRENFQRELLNTQAATLQAQSALTLDIAKKLELDRAAVIIKAQSDSIGKTKDQQILIEKQKQAQIKQIDDEATKALLENRLALYRAAAVLEKDDAVKSELEKQAIIVQAQIDSIGKSKEQALIIEKQKQAAITAIDLEQTKRRLELRSILLRRQGILETDDLKKLEIQKQQVLLQAQIDSAGKSKDEIIAIEEEKKNKIIEINQQIEAAKRAMYATTLDVASSLIGSLREISNNQFAEEEAQRQSKHDEDIKLLKDRLNKGLINQKEYDKAAFQSEEQFAKQSRILKRKQAQEDKQLALFQAIINTASAVVKALPNIPLSVFAGILGFAQIAIIQSKPLPAFKKGTKDAPGGPSLVGEAGPELIYHKGNWQYANKATVLDLPKHAKVIPTLDTQKILSKYDIPMPAIQQNVSTSVGGINIDYAKLGAVVGKEIAKIPLQQNNWDENGFTSYQTSMSQRKSYLNNKFKSPR